MMPDLYECPQMRLHDGDRRLFGSKPKMPQRNSALDRMQLKLMKEQLKMAKKSLHFPELRVPPPAPPPPPPPMGNSADVQEAQQDARRQALRRSGIASTIMAGETGDKAATLG